MKISLKPLSEQVIIITGASSGIGLITARMAAKRGATVVAGARNEEALRTLAYEIRSSGGRAAYAVCDVGDPEQVQRLAETSTREFGGFDTWVNNAGISIFGRLWDVPLADWERMFATVYWGTVYGSLTALRHFREAGRPGAIVNSAASSATRRRLFRAPTLPQSSRSTASRARSGRRSSMRAGRSRCRSSIRAASTRRITSMRATTCRCSPSIVA